MSKIVDSYPANKKGRKAKILEKQSKIDDANQKEREKALKKEEDNRNKGRKGKVAAKRAAAKKREGGAKDKDPVKVNFASDEAGELAVKEKLSDAEIASITGTGKGEAITVKDIKDFLTAKAKK